MSRRGPIDSAADLVEVLHGPEERLRELLVARDPNEMREAARLITEAAADPAAFGAVHGDAALARIRADRRTLERLHRVYRRDEALEALYAAEQRGGDLDVAGLSPQAGELARAVWADRVALDGTIGEAAEGWAVTRMAPVDRNVLRIGLWELEHRPETPVPVVVSEAVRLAKAYSTENSGRFVNGVMAALAEKVRPR